MAKAKGQRGRRTPRTRSCAGARLLHISPRRAATSCTHRAAPRQSGSTNLLNPLSPVRKPRLGQPWLLSAPPTQSPAAAPSPAPGPGRPHAEPQAQHLTTPQLVHAADPQAGRLTAQFADWSNQLSTVRMLQPTRKGCRAARAQRSVSKHGRWRGRIVAASYS